jgi:hypothetical protein
LIRFETLFNESEATMIASKLLKWTGKKHAYHYRIAPKKESVEQKKSWWNKKRVGGTKQESVEQKLKIN